MIRTDKNLDALQDIRKMMERSSRFISLSGWSGISAGICALIGAWVGNSMISQYQFENSSVYTEMRGEYIFRDSIYLLQNKLLLLAVCVFITAAVTAFIFTYFKSKRDGIAIWGKSAQRLMWNTILPLIAGGLLILRLVSLQQYLLIAPVCLIFYGLALVNGSKYTLGEIRYLGYFQLLLGVVNLWLPGYGLIFWAFGFGVLHIIYGIAMWWKYDRTNQS
jgi:hypothetical protein